MSGRIIRALVITLLVLSALGSYALPKDQGSYPGIYVVRPGSAKLAVPGDDNRILLAAHSWTQA
jgi:hypothetical protein